MGVLVEALRRVEFLAALPAVEVERFMVLGRCSMLPRRHVFWRTGDEPQDVVIVVSGEVKTVTRSEDGRELLHAFFGPGECVGLPGALDGLPRPHDAIVARDGEFLTVRRDVLMSFLDRNPPARRAAMSTVGRMYRLTLRDHDEAALRTATQRMARFLLRTACVRQADGSRVLVDATLAEMASRVGMVPEVASRLLSRLRRAGLVRRRRRTVFIRDWAGLSAAAGSELDVPVSAELDSAARDRTQRFFLPVAADQRRQRLLAEAALCRAELGDLALCRVRGCPLALEEAVRAGSMPHREVDTSPARPERRTAEPSSPPDDIERHG